MSVLFNNHSCLVQILKHKDLPIYKTYEFNFFRCVNVEDWVYGKTLSTLHAGNLRKNDKKHRYSKLFPNKKISYWADSKATALAEIKKHDGNKNYLTFWAYDDRSSTFPTLDVENELVIIDGREFFLDILLKIEMDEELTVEESQLVKRINKEEPDCLAYQSMADSNGINFLFFEKGFKKLALREVKLYFGENKSKNAKKIRCAFGSDYSPVIENYGKCFESIVKVKTDSDYINTEEYKLRYKNYEDSSAKIREAYSQGNID